MMSSLSRYLLSGKFRNNNEYSNFIFQSGYGVSVGKRVKIQALS